MDIAKVSGAVGAEIHDIDLNNLDDNSFESIRAALFEHGVIFFRDQALTPDNHIALAERFGEIDVNRFFTPVASHPQIAEVRTNPDMTKVIGGTWHSDHSYDAEPAMASTLVARELPPYGGDTLFASAVAACDALSVGLRATLEGMSAWHSDASFGNSKVGLSGENVTKPNLHPVLVRHPVTGARSIYVNGDFTTHFDGWTPEESAPLLDYLYRFIPRPEFSCRFRWTPGSVAIWDNRLVQHFACADYAGHARLMHRVTVKGVRLFG